MPLKREKNGEGEILRKFYAVAEPSGGCLDRFGRAERTTPWRFVTAVASRPPSLRAAPFVKGEYFPARLMCKSHAKEAVGKASISLRLLPGRAVEAWFGHERPSPLALET